MAKTLTRKQKAFVKHLVDNPKASGKAAATEAYNTTTPHTAEVISSRLLRKDEIQTELAKYSGIVENSIITTINRYKDSTELDEVKEAMQNARWVHDKVHGRATQKVETTSRSVSINIDLTQGETPPVDAS